MKAKVLIVDDSLTYRLWIEMILMGDYDVHLAEDGTSGLAIARALRPDLILLDIMMPGIDGWETLTRLKRDPDTAAIPVIIFTAREHARGHQKSTEMGAAD